MKKNFLKKAMALGLTVALGTSTVIFAADNAITSAGGYSASGSAGVKNPIYRVVFPTTLPLSIDAFEQALVVTGSQISAGKYPIINKSNVPVQVAINATVTANNNTTIVAKSQVPDGTDLTDTSKNIYFAVVPAISTSNLTLDGTADAASSFATSAVTEYATKDGLEAAAASKVAGKAPANLTFALAAATYKSATPTILSSLTATTGAVGGVSTFTFVGKANPNAKWAAGDLKVLLEYSISGLNTTSYTLNSTATVKSTDTLQTSVAAIKVASATNAPIAPTITTVSNTSTIAASGRPDATYTISWGDAQSISEVRLSKTPGSFVLDNSGTLGSGGGYTLSDKTLTIRGSGGFWTGDIVPNGAGTYKIRVSFDDGSKVMIDMIVS